MKEFLRLFHFWKNSFFEKTLLWVDFEEGIELMRDWAIVFKYRGMIKYIQGSK